MSSKLAFEGGGLAGLEARSRASLSVSDEADIGIR